LLRRLIKKPSAWPHNPKRVLLKILVSFLYDINMISQRYYFKY
jgi:hypothetical protein